MIHEGAPAAAAIFEPLLGELAAHDAVRSAVVRLERADGGLIWTGAAGVSRADTAAPMTPESRFHVASVTKTLTAALILQLAEEGALGEAGLETPLAQTGAFSPETVARLHPMGADELTLRRLLTHTGGLRDAMVDDAEVLGGPAPQSLVGRMFRTGDVSRRWDPWDPAHPDDPEAGVINYFLNAWIAAAPLFAPGSAFHYSDTGYMILGVVAERLGGAPLHRLFRRRLFEPLGMHRTYLAYRDDPADLGPARRPESDPCAGDLALLSADVSLSFDWAGGGVVSTAEDLALFLRGTLSGRLFTSKASLEAMTEVIAPDGLAPPRTGVGLGLLQVAHPGGVLIGHSGAWGARMFQDVETGVVLTGTINQSQGLDTWHWPFIAAAQALVKAAGEA